MKNIYRTGLFLFIAASFLFGAGCYTTGPNVPPGQAKKYHGDRSARDYAPGHRKRHRRHDRDRYYDNRHDDRYDDWRDRDDDDDDRDRYRRDRKDNPLYRRQ